MNDFILGPQAPLGSTWFDAVQITKGKALGEACPAIPPANTEAEVIKIGNITNTYNMLHYYDLARCMYIAHKRSGDALFLSLARKCADSYWQHPLWIGGGTIRPWPDSAVTPKFAGIGGLILRALDGKPEYWDWINSYTQFVFDHWVKKRIGATELFYGVREGAFALQYAAWLAVAHPDGAIRAAYLADVQTSAMHYYGKLQQPDGSWRWNDPDFKADDGGLLVGVMQPFMIGLLLHALSDVYEIATDSTVKASVGNQIVKACRHLYADGPYRKDDPVPYDSSKRWRSLWYFYHGGTTVNPTRFAKGGYSLPGNNAGEVGDQRQGIGLLVAAYGRAYQISGDSAFKAMGDELWDAAYGGSDGIRNLFDSDGKGYNQNARWAGSYLVWAGQPAIPSQPQPAPPIPPIPPATPSPPNVALAANGATASASSTFGTQSPAHAINGDRKGLNSSWWADNTSNGYPDWIEVNFGGSKTINEIDVFGLQQNPSSPVEPTLAMTSSYALTNFEVQYWTGSAWATVPGGSVVGNDKVWRKFTFPPLVTSKIRVWITSVAGDNRSQVVEIEAYAAPDSAPIPPPAPAPSPAEPQYEFKKFRWPTDDAGQDAAEKQAAAEGWTDCYVAGNWLRCKRLRQ